MSPSTSSLGHEASADGRFKRQDSRFRDQVAVPEAGRYHLYVSWACPWAHRAIIGRRLKGLEDAIGLSVVDPVRDHRGWRFSGGAFTDEVNGFDFLGEAYEATEPGFDGRYSVPVLWDKRERRSVNNESGDILRMLDTTFQPLPTTDVVLAPSALREDIDELNAFLYDNVNNAVYKAGFTSNQDVYEEEVTSIFSALDGLDDRPGIAETVRFDQIRAHYYGTHPSINPSGIVALQPRGGDFTAPPGRDQLP